MSAVFILHENAAWLPPFRAAFAEAGLPFEEWHLDGGRIDLSRPPPEGVFYNRMSASALTRGHDRAAATAAATLDWLKLHGRTVLNGPNALRLELSKAAQYAALATAGVATPRTLIAVGAEEIPAAAGAFGDAPFILKPNRGGKGLGVRLIQDGADLERQLPEIAAEPSADDVWLIQEYCPAPDGAIVRMEFIGGRLHYAVRVNTGGAFELCPAEACAIDGAPPMFEILDDAPADLTRKLEAFLAANAIDVAGIEHMATTDGRLLVYDINTNTNYNPDAETAAEVEAGPAALARHISGLIDAARGRRAA